MRPLELLRDSGNMAQYASDFFPPNFADWKMYVAEMVVTLQIAVWGTALAVVSAVPLGLLASANITPWWIHQPVRRVLDSFRAINEMVFAMLFVVAVGLGPFAGVMAITINRLSSAVLKSRPNAPKRLFPILGRSSPSCTSAI